MVDFEQNKRLKEVIEHGFKMSPIEFAKAYNDKKAVKTYNILSNRNGISNKMLVEILTAYPQINKVWLLTGEGEMLNSEPPRNESTKDNNNRSRSLSKTQPYASEETAKMVLLLPLSAQGGGLNDFVVSVKASECEKVVSPIRDVDFAMTVSGDSMSPEYPNGSRIYIKKINEKAFIEWGKAYVLDTCNGTVIKTLVPSEKEGFVRCVSINTDPIFAPFDVSLDDIYGVYKVLICMSMK